MRYKTKFDNIVDAHKELENMLCDDTYRYLHCDIFEEQDKDGKLVCFRIGKPHELARRFNVDEIENILTPL